jgi:hypothetical protein
LSLNLEELAAIPQEIPGGEALGSGEDSNSLEGEDVGAEIKKIFQLTVFP